MEPKKDKSKKISARSNEGCKINSKRDRCANEGIAEPSGEENITAKKARVEGPNVALQMNKQWANVVPVSPVLATAGGSGIMSLTGDSVGTSASASLNWGPIPSSIPPWAPNLVSSESPVNTSADIDMDHNRELIGRGSSFSSDTFVPHRTNVGSGIASVGSSTGMDMPQNFASAQRSAGNGVGIFFIGGAEQDCTEMERVENANGIEVVEVSSAAAVSGTDNRNRPRRLQRTINFRDLQRAMEMDPELAKYGQ